MEPRLQYARTSDGVSIAFWAAGQGVPLFIPPNLYGSHFQVELDVSPAKAFGQLIEKTQIILHAAAIIALHQ